MTIDQAQQMIYKLGLHPNIFDRYNEPHRHYHNWNHVLYMLTKAEENNILDNDLFLAILFHDVIYDPKSTTNEEDSAYLFSLFFNDMPHVEQAILETKTHKPTTELSIKLCDLDLAILKEDLKGLIKFENEIFKEYQWVDLKTYKEKRLEVLISIGATLPHIQLFIAKQFNIGVYAGSFNPFHRGHQDVLNKAERIFDKVIIARGINPDKNNELEPLDESLKYHEIINYNGLITTMINNIGYPVTLVRGLRNSSDFEYELNQYRYIQELKPDINIVSIFCDANNAHISSSAVRNLKKYKINETQTKS